MAGPNPYAPGAGDRPRALAGRSEQLALADAVRRQIEAGYPANSLVFTGLRGVGKTVLLKEVADRLTRAGWCAPYLELRRDIAVDTAFADAADRVAALLPAASRLARRWREVARRGGGATVMGSGASVGAAARRDDGYGELRRVLLALCGAARHDGSGVALVVDELQTLRARDLAQLVHMVQDLRDGGPFAFLGAGLPYLPSYISRAVTYAERLRFEPVEPLGALDARSAVADPARAEGGRWSDGALDRLVALADGYPHFLQLFAYEAWELAARRDGPVRVGVADVTASEASARRQAEAGIFAARFDAVGAAGARYLLAMLAVSPPGDRRGRSRSGEVARHLGIALSAASPTRDTLIRRGVIHAPEHGVVEYSIPGFADYLRRRQAAAAG